MKRRKIIALTWSILKDYICWIIVLYLLMINVDTAILPPPWADPNINPCVTMPGGWQLIYWAPLKKCFKIFSLGHPCPETMELSPTAYLNSYKKKSLDRIDHAAAVAECRCPPGTILNGENNKCYKIYEKGPCSKGQYFSPISDIAVITKRASNRWGVCKIPPSCPDGMIFWPKDGKCYTKLTKGPCAHGKLLVLNKDGLGECQCQNTGQLGEFFYVPDETCYEHYTRGPCSIKGELFLPGGYCGCHSSLPHFHTVFQKCYELNSRGPCKHGQIFRIPEENFANSTGNSTMHAECQCKDNYIPWSDGLCYRLYTQGPCNSNEFLINSTTCVEYFCGKNRLYFPDQRQCYRIGSQGPCDLHQVVVFDFTVRPSVDGISYNGVCGCTGIITNLDQKCTTNKDFRENTCESTPGMVEIEGNCYKLYTRGPCNSGQWLEPIKTASNVSHRLEKKAKCVCRPGYILAENLSINGTIFTKGLRHCNAPNFGLARYLTQHFYKQRTNSKSTSNYIEGHHI